jgi:ABC-type multidrug transport system ATPase subunit
MHRPRTWERYQRVAVIDHVVDGQRAVQGLRLRNRSGSPTAALPFTVWKEIQSLSDSGMTVFLTTQHLEEAEKLADRIAILHQGTIIVSGTLAELRTLLPPAKTEHVERQPTLEEIFLAIVGRDRTPHTTKRSSDGHACPQRHRSDARALDPARHAQPGHHHHGHDHADRVHAAVKLATQQRFGRVAVKSRATRSLARS